MPGFVCGHGGVLGEAGTLQWGGAELHPKSEILLPVKSD